MADTVIEAEIKSNVGEVADQTERLADATDDAKKGFKGVSKTVKGVGTAMKAAGIGLFVALFAKLMEVFGKNQKVIDKFETAMISLSIAFNDFFKFLEDNIGTITGYFKDIFENPQQALKDFGDAIKTNLIERFNSLLETFGLLGKSLKLLIDGEFGEAWEVVKQAGKESIDVLTGVDGSLDKITETITNASNAIVEYGKNTLKTAGNIIELSKAAQLAAATNQQIIEQKDREAELQRQIRDDETKTFEQRIAANEELGRILESQKVLMLENADAIIAAAEAQKKLNDNDENAILLIQAKTEKDAVLAQITGFQSEQIVNQVSLQKEQAALAMENADMQIQAYSDLAGALSSLAGDNKALAIAQATIDTFAGANKAFAQGGVAGFVTGAAIIAAGLSNVRKILSTDVGGEGGGGGLTPSIESTPAPEMLSGAFTLGGVQEQQPVQAYVVTDDMTNNQNKLANIRRRATI